MNSLLTDRAASPPAWPCKTRGQVCHSGGYAITAEVRMNNAGSVCSWPVYHFLHPEPVDFNQDPLALSPMQPGRKAFDANQAVSTILFERSSRRFHELYPSLKKLRHHRLAFFTYLLSRGFEHPSLMPTLMIRPVLALERFLGVLGRYLAFRILVVLEKKSPWWRSVIKRRDGQNHLWSHQMFSQQANQRNQTNEMNQINQTSEMNQTNQTNGFHRYVLRIKSRHEKLVRDRFDFQGIEPLRSTVKRMSQWKDRKKEIEAPPFSGYCFVRFTS